MLDNNNTYGIRRTLQNFADKSMNIWLNISDFAALIFFKKF
jgi:hypothetical protein